MRFDLGRELKTMNGSQRDAYQTGFEYRANRFKSNLNIDRERETRRITAHFRPSTRQRDGSTIASQ